MNLNKKQMWEIKFMWQFTYERKGEKDYFIAIHYSLKCKNTIQKCIPTQIIWLRLSLASFQAQIRQQNKFLTCLPNPWPKWKQMHVTLLDPSQRIKWNGGCWNCPKPSGSIIMEIDEQSESGFPEEISIFITVSVSGRNAFQSVPILI